MFELTREPIDPAPLLAAVRGPERGAVVLFLGDVRGESAGRKVEYLEYEAYESMALRALAAIGAGLAERFPGCVCAIRHRLGRVLPGECSVAIAVATPHRANSYAASREAIEALKRDVPIWKKEHREGGAVWVEGPSAPPG